MEETSNSTPAIASYRIDAIANKDEAKQPSSKENNLMKFILLAFLAICIIFVVYYIFQIKQKPGSQSTAQPTPSETLEKDTNPARLVGVNENYLKLDSILYQLTKATDYSAYGKRYELDVAGDNVRVEIELNDTAFILPKSYGSEIRRSGKMLTALVPIEKLVELTDDVRIIAIRKPES